MAEFGLLHFDATSQFFAEFKSPLVHYEKINRTTKHINIGSSIPKFVFSEPWCNLYRGRALPT